MSTQQTDSIFENYVNGNLSDAQQQAKIVPLTKLLAAAREWFPSEGEAFLITLFLKRQITFQQLCESR